MNTPAVATSNRLPGGSRYMAGDPTPAFRRGAMGAGKWAKAVAWN